MIEQYHPFIRLSVGIPSHLGIKGNEMADKAAQRASSNQFVKLELKEIYKMITKYVMKKRQPQDEYNTSQPCMKSSLSQPAPLAASTAAHSIQGGDSDAQSSYDRCSYSYLS